LPDKEFLIKGLSSHLNIIAIPHTRIYFIRICKLDTPAIQRLKSGQTALAFSGGMFPSRSWKCGRGGFGWCDQYKGIKVGSCGDAAGRGIQDLGRCSEIRIRV
jgi:hypothetical protein